MFDRQKKRKLAEFMRNDAAQAGVQARSGPNIISRLGARMQAWAAARIAADFTTMADDDDEKSRNAKAERGPWAE